MAAGFGAKPALWPLIKLVKHIAQAPVWQGKAAHQVGGLVAGGVQAFAGKGPHTGQGGVDLYRAAGVVGGSVLQGRHVGPYGAAHGAGGVADLGAQPVCRAVARSVGKIELAGAVWLAHDGKDVKRWRRLRFANHGVQHLHTPVADGGLGFAAGAHQVGGAVLHTGYVGAGLVTRHWHAGPGAGGSDPTVLQLYRAALHHCGAGYGGPAHKHTAGDGAVLLGQ